MQTTIAPPEAPTTDCCRCWLFMAADTVYVYLLARAVGDVGIADRNVQLSFRTIVVCAKHERELVSEQTARKIHPSKWHINQSDGLCV